MITAQQARDRVAVAYQHELRDILLRICEEASAGRSELLTYAQLDRSTIAELECRGYQVNQATRGWFGWRKTLISWK